MWQSPQICSSLPPCLNLSKDFMSENFQSATGLCKASTIPQVLVVSASINKLCTIYTYRSSRINYHHLNICFTLFFMSGNSAIKPVWIIVTWLAHSQGVTGNRSWCRTVDFILRYSGQTIFFPLHESFLWRRTNTSKMLAHHLDYK